LLRIVLAHARYHLGCNLFDRLSHRERCMIDEARQIHNLAEVAPGEEHEVRVGPRILVYATGFGLAILLTATSFFVAGTDLVWQPSIPVALVVLAIAQMGVHLVFFLHITTGPDNTNNVLALAFGLLIVFLVVGGSIWIMDQMNHNMMPPGMHKH
jgi:cytochrome o ubiquinol oxidase subunit IV